LDLHYPTRDCTAVIRDEELLIYFKEFSADEAEYQEKRAILEYTRRYGEPPPHLEV